MKKWLTANTLTHAAFFAGLLGISAAIAMVYLPAGVFVLGCELVWLSILASRS